MQLERKKFFGPAILVTAAFIGPGTVMVASRTGAQSGYSLLWAVLFSVFAAIVLQEMAARLGIATGEGLSQAIKNSFRNPIAKFVLLGLILAAILIGNAAYQTGNLLGAAAGIAAVMEKPNDEVETDNDQLETEQDALNPGPAKTLKEKNDSNGRGMIGIAVWTVLIGGLALGVILLGQVSLLQNLLTILVIAMSCLFLLAAGLSRPDLGAIASGLIPRLPEPDQWWSVVALIGTTVVPYNLFLHASAAAERWRKDPDTPREQIAIAVKESRRDTIWAIAIGGTVTGAILVTAAEAFFVEGVESVPPASVKEVAIQLQPAVGSWAKWLFGAGLFAAGLTSGITAPIAAAYAAAGCFGWPGKLSDWRLKTVASLVVLTGVVFAIALGGSPLETIVLAQAANGLLLPVVAAVLLVILNRSSLMGDLKNSALGNFLAVVVLLVATLIAAGQMRSVYPKIKELKNKYQTTSVSVADLVKVPGTSS